MAKSEKAHAAYVEGFDARLRGKGALDNPYRKLTERWFEWADGWKDQDHHLEQRAAALEFTFGHRR